jgi:hypothetical protein
MFTRLISLSITAVLTLGAVVFSPVLAQLPLGTLQLAYGNNFEGSEFKLPGVGALWSPHRIATTPSGRKFLGQFANEAVFLKVAGITAHSHVAVYFDLYLSDNWDGNGLCINNHANGPDIFDLSVVGGPTLLHTTFSNVPGHPQAYPGPFFGTYNPCNPSPAAGLPFNAAGTGAAEKNTLGYSLDSVYRLNYTFAHTGPSLTLKFSSSVTSPDKEMFGLDNVRVLIAPSGHPTVPPPGHPPVHPPDRHPIQPPGHPPIHPPANRKADLTVSITGPVYARAGDNIGAFITTTARNLGAAAAPGTSGSLDPANGYVIDVVLSTDRNVPPSPASYSAAFSEDVLLRGGRIGNTVDLAPLATKSYPSLSGGSGTIPADTPTGVYSVCARIDPANRVAESNEANNVACFPIKIERRR